MPIKPLPLICVFVGGCLSGAVLVGFSGGASRSPSAEGTAQAVDSIREEEVSPPRAVERRVAELAPAKPVRVEESHAEPVVDPGRSVADVLGGLEAAYRDALAVAAAPAPPASETVNTESAPKEQTPAEVPESKPAAREVPEQVAIAESAVAVAQVPEQVAIAESAVAVAELPSRSAAATQPEVVREPVSAAPVSVADARPNIINVTVNHGDVYQVEQLQQLQDLQQLRELQELQQLRQLQQLQVLQVLQLVGQSPYAEHGTSAPRRRGSQRGAPRAASPISTPQGGAAPYRDWGSGFPTSSSSHSTRSPWGFSIPGSVLVR